MDSISNLSDLEDHLFNESKSLSSSDSEFEFQFEIDDKEYYEVITEIHADSDTEGAVKIKPKCTICHKEFARKYNLERHLMIHQANRCYICEICGKTIRGAISLHQKVCVW